MKLRHFTLTACAALTSLIIAACDSAPAQTQDALLEERQLEEICETLSKQEGVQYELLSGKVLAVDLYPYDGMDCFDRKLERHVPCLDNNRAGIIRLELSKTNIPTSAPQIVVYTKPIPRAVFDSDFFVRLDRNKNQLKICGTRVPDLSFIPADKQSQIPKYEVLSIDYIGILPTLQGG